MAAEQSMVKAVMQAAIEATKAAVMAVREADNPVISARPIQRMPRSGSKYQEVYNF